MRYNRFHRETNFLTPTLFTQELSEYAAKLRFEDLPAGVVERAKAMFLHTMGAVFAAKNTPVGKNACRMALEANGGEGGPTTLWTTGQKAGAVHAALAMGVLADALDWEGYSWTGPAPAAAVPCAWLAAEEKHKSGRELLKALAAGYEVYQRIAMAVQPDEARWKRGWGVTSWQIFAAILPVAVLYGFDARRINQAIGVGCESSTLPTRYHLTTMSDFGHYEYGYRARDGFMVVKAVERGIHNCRDALDESRCYRGVICGTDAANGDGDEIVSGDESDPTWFTRELGSRCLILETVLKRWPAALWAQAPAEAANRMRKASGFRLEDIEEILVSPAVEGFMDVPAGGYGSSLQAQVSVPFAIASVLAGGEPGAEWYTEETRKSPQITALAQRVRAAGKPMSEYDAFAAFREGRFPETTVTIALRGGGRLEETAAFPAGRTDGAPSLEEAAQRFCAQTGGVLAPERADAIIDAVCHLEDASDIAELSNRLFAG